MRRIMVKIKPYITIFSPNQAPRIYNNQLIRYAGYEHAGDPSEREITQLAEHLGWKGKGTDFDVLPLIYQLPNDSIKWYELPNELIKEVEIEHEHYPKLKDLNLKWYGVPIISNMDLKIGGITYPTAPFNGWYMVTEIAVRNFTDSYRYNLLESIAEAFEFGTLKIILLIKIEHSLNLIMRYTIHLNLKVFLLLMLTASKQFQLFEEKELANNRDVTGKWSWLAPPLSPTLTSNYHHGYNNEMDPNFHYKRNSQ